MQVGLFPEHRDFWGPQPLLGKPPRRHAGLHDTSVGFNRPAASAGQELPHLQPDAGRLETAAKIAENIGGRDIALPGAKSLVAFVAAWDSLALRLPPEAGMGPAAELILKALKLAFANQQHHTSHPQLRHTGPTQGQGQDLQAPGAPAGRAIQIATALADLIAEGVPLDAESIAAGILAEAVSVGSLSTRVVEARLGSGVAQLLHDIMRVRALPKRLDIYDDVATSSLRELCLAFYDMRATVVEVVARAMHLEHPAAAAQPQWARQMAALEALQIYSPLGHALGLRSISAAMEDRCFQELFPASYREMGLWLRREVAASRGLLDRCQADLHAALAASPRLSSLVVSWQVDGRVKSLFSTMKKVLRLGEAAKGGRAREDIFDVLGLRIILDMRHSHPSSHTYEDAAEACNLVLDTVQQLWEPLEGRVKDYVATPKPNGYQSLHATVRLPALTLDVNSESESTAAAEQDNMEGAGLTGPSLEVQIRTREMHEQAESGEAAHAAYKGGLDAGQAQRLQAWTHALQSAWQSQQPRQPLPASPNQEALSIPALRLPARGSTEVAAEELFRHLDTDGDGRLSRQEMQAAMQDLGVAGNASAAAGELMDAVGALGSPDIAFSAFLEFQKKAGLLRAIPQVDKETAWRLALPRNSSASSASPSRAASCLQSGGRPHKQPAQHKPRKVLQ
ncbi:hypothetical protein WJX84_011061 [Apatococcus fuscideae]|uniref:EF-hand domain-containing protein n=1 Tax=Apatococcus fuscideae TaxID=2026836 RepID=A0AAW1TE60_9CHLO